MPNCECPLKLLPPLSWVYSNQPRVSFENFPRKNIRHKNIILALLFAIIASTSLHAYAQPLEYCDVYVGEQKAFTVATSNIQPAVERAGDITNRIQSILDNSKMDPERMKIRQGFDNVPVIVLDSFAICSVRPQDVAGTNLTAQQQAEQWMRSLKSKMIEEKKKVPETHSKNNSSLSEHAVLLLFLEIGVLLLASLFFGELLVKFGQPAIIGQILAGLVLGQTFFGNLFPDLSIQLFPQDSNQSKLLQAVSWIGVSFLLMLTGMETDTSMLKRLGKPALYIAFIGLVIPLATGALIALLLPESLQGSPEQKIAFMVFVGTVFAVSSVPVVAKILMDMKLLKRDVGQLVLSASLSHDLLCCLLLAVIAVLAGAEGGQQKSGVGGSGPLLTAIFGTIGFLLAIYFGRPLVFAGLRWISDNVSTSDGLVTAMVVMVLLSAATTQALGIHIVLGAFAVGVILSQAPVINHKVVRPLEIVTMAFFAPIFFAGSGLNINLGSLLQPQLAGITILLCAVSMLSKLAGCYLAGKLTGLGAWESLAVGVGANAKGSMGLILAMLGFSLNLITIDMVAIVIFVSLFSTAVAPPLLRWSLSKVKVSPAELDRLAKEERRDRSVMSSIRRVLWPTSGKARNHFIGQLLESIGTRQVIEATVLWVKTPKTGIPKDEQSSTKPFRSVSKAINTKLVGLVKLSVESDEPAKAIIEETNRGYDLLVMATDEPPADAEYVFGDLVDTVILNTSTRVLVIYEPEQHTQREIKKVLVPVSGSELSVTAAEFGISLANSLNAQVVCVSISDETSEKFYGEETKSGIKIQKNITEEVEGSLKELANALDVKFTNILMQGSSIPAQAIILAAQQQNADLIVLGAEPKLAKGLFLGHTINFILRHAPCAVAVLKMQA